MKISYTVNPEDIVTFNLRHLKSSPNFKKSQLKGRILFPLIYGGLALVLLVLSTDYWPLSWILGFIALLWAIFYPKVWEYRLRRYVLKLLKKRGDHGVHELTFEDDGLAAKNNVKDGWIPWENILNVIHSDDYLFLYVTKDDAIIVPRSGLIDNENDDWPSIRHDLVSLCSKNAVPLTSNH